MKPKNPIKDPVWQHIQGLAFDYYNDRDNKNKRTVLHNALFKKFNASAEYSPIENLARTVVKATRHKWDLGESVTVLSEEVLSNALLRTNKLSDLPYARATALLDYGYDPSKGAAFHTWFSLMLRSVLTDMLRSYISRRKHEVSAQTDLDYAAGDAAGTTSISHDEDSSKETETLLNQIFSEGD
jgi:hypothetical protein